MARIPDIGVLTTEQTAELAGTCLSMLDITQVIAVVKSALDKDDQEELAAQLMEETP